MSCIVLKLINHHPQKGFDHHEQVGDESETLWKEISVGTTVGAMLLWVPRWVLCSCGCHALVGTTVGPVGAVAAIQGIS